MSPLLFWIFVAIMLFFGGMVVLNRNPVASALSLVVCFLALAALFVSLDAYFIGVIQILVYGDSLTWGIVPGTRERLRFAARWPGVTTKRSCFPQASQRKATILPSGDQAGAEGYLICEMRSIVMLPRGGSAAVGTASDRQTRAPVTDDGNLMSGF
jgi:uncharacterized membrane protein (DUF485 family)